MIKLLLEGCYIRKYQGESLHCNYKLYRGNQQPVLLLTEGEITLVKPYTRLQAGKILLDRRLVRSADGRKYIKKAYRRSQRFKNQIVSK